MSDFFKTITYDLHRTVNNEYPYRVGGQTGWNFTSKQAAIDYIREHFSKIEKVLQEAKLPLKGI